MQKGWILTTKSGREIVVLELEEPYVSVMQKFSAGDTWIPKSLAAEYKSGPHDWECTVVVEYVGHKENLEAVKHMYSYYMRDPITKELRVE